MSQLIQNNNRFYLAFILAVKFLYYISTLLGDTCCHFTNIRRDNLIYMDFQLGDLCILIMLLIKSIEDVSYKGSAIHATEMPKKPAVC